MSMSFYTTSDVISHLIRLSDVCRLHNNEDTAKLVNDIKDSIELSLPKYLPKYQSFKETSYWIISNGKRHCANCGKGNGVKSKFCPSCGSQMIDERKV